jgi:hypothetical protein
MFVTPNLILVDQFLKDFDNYSLLSNMIPHDDRLIVASKSNRTEIYTTSSDTISNFLFSKSKSLSSSLVSSSPENNNIKLLVCTYASLKRVGEVISIINDSIDNNSNNNSNNQMTIEFDIFDEAHTMEGISKQTGHGLDDSNIPISYRFFLTATPRNCIDNPKYVLVYLHLNKNYMVDEQLYQHRYYHHH